MTERIGGYDADVVVLGAGPAGLAAAIRVRWVKGYEAMPASVLLVDPEPPGGLAAMGGCVLTGPGFATNAAGITGPLLADLERLAIPRVPESAMEISPGPGGMHEVALDSGRRLRCHAVIVATGFRQLHGEARWFGSGVHLTYKGTSYFPDLLARAAREADGRGVVLIGHSESAPVARLLTPELVATAGGFTMLLEDAPEAMPELPHGVRAVLGRSVAYYGEERLEGVGYRATGGEDRRLDCGAVLVDYHAFEQRPQQPPAAGPARDDRGFVAVDASLATSMPGVFAAGDVTGRYASTAMALGDGVCAGFSAWEHVFARKYGRPPDLFAYAVRKSLSPAEDPGRPFPLPGAAFLVPLGSAEALEQLFAEHPGVLASVLGRGTVGAVRTALGDDRAADRLLFRAMHRRLLTLHHSSEDA